MVKKRRGAGAEGFVLPTLKKVRGYVVGKNGAYAGAIISIGNETVFFGRDPQQCQMVFDASQQQISRVHCSLRYDETLGCFLLENYSRNGTYLGDGPSHRGWAAGQAGIRRQPFIWPTATTCLN